MINNILHNALLASNKNSDDKFDSNNPLTFTAQEDNSTIVLVIKEYALSSPVVDGLQYRTNINSGWSTYNIDTVIELTNVGDYVQFQNTKDQLSSNSNYVRFEMTGKIAASGNIQSMLNYSKSCKPFCYAYMFDDCTNLTEAPKLPATTLANHCYKYMFNGCTSLSSAPKLPATTLVDNCYAYMFDGCTSLTTAPKLLATNLAPHCYYYMFRNCTSLSSAPKLPATTLVDSCYVYMFYGCTSLSSAPKLPATTLADGCYLCMFWNCTSLNYVKVEFTDWNSNESSTTGWLHNVSPIGTFVCPEELVSAGITYGEKYIPKGWTVETIESNV